MSWSTFGSVEAGSVKTNHEQVDGVEAVEVRAAVESLMLDLIAAGHLGDPNGKYRFNLSGHANPEHKPVPKWANDQVHIVISQMDDE